MESGYRKLLKNPRKSANLCSILFFGWSIPFFKESYNKTLQPNDAYEPLDEDRSKVLGDRLESSWQEEIKNNRNPSLVRALIKAFWRETVVLGILCFFTDCIAKSAFSILIGKILSFFREKPEITRNDVLNYGLYLFVLTVCYGITLIHYYFRGHYYAMRVRVALSSIIYRKALLLSQKSLSETSSGKLVNLLSNDVHRFYSLTFLHPLWTAPVMTIISTYILYREIQWAGVFGVVIILLFAPIQSYAGKLAGMIRFQAALKTDERVRFMDEIISGAQVIKLYAWEKPFAKLIAATRRLELKTILKSYYVRVVYITLGAFATRIALFATVLTFVLLYGSENMVVSKMFIAAYLYSMITFGMCQVFIRGVSDMSEAFMAIKRLQMFLEYEERVEDYQNDSVVSHKLESQNISILIKNATANWSETDEHENSKKSNKKVGYKNARQKVTDGFGEQEHHQFRLQNINLEVPKGKLIFVVGSVGAGKSSLLQVLLKELPLASGSMDINGSISYASQESWIFTSTIRQNITFGQSMDRSRYDDVIKSTALAKDLTQFSDGDMTLVGEHGAGLSGGQKPRINLARAVYRKADIYLIDDPLSAVDTHVQSHLFSKCLGPNGYLAQQNATRILVTHQLHFLKEADWIVVLKEGSIEIQGDYDTILKSGVDFASDFIESEESREGNSNEMSTNSNRRKSISSKIASSESLKNPKESNDSEGELEEENKLLNEMEGSSQGKVKGSLLLNYFKYAKRPFALILLFASFLTTQALANFADVWVSYWIRKEETRPHHFPINETFFTEPNNTRADSENDSDLWPTERYVYIYSAVMLSFLVITGVRSTTFFSVCVSASQNLHDTMFRGLISTKMRFFDENPAGRITNRFTKDLGSVDDILPRAIFDAVFINLNMLGALLITVFTDIKLSIVILLLSVLFMSLRKIYLKSSTNIRRLEGITKSPVFSHISATLTGLSTVRAFQAENILQDEFEGHQDLNSGTLFMFIGTSTGFGMALDLMVYVYVGCVLYFFLILNQDVSGDRIGLAITQSLSLTGILQYGVIQSADVTNHLMSVERIIEYCQLQPEKQPDIPEKVSSDWPSKGKVEFKDVSYRYSEDGEPVLRGLTFSVEPKEKVSVVGRTGAGKSSLISSIFRLAHVDGEILLDGVNTSRVDLSVLRSRVSIIPQEPILFSGTLRRNLDPFEEYSDDDIWRALENVELKDYVLKSNGLQMEVLARGQNFSVGQRQILCLARAILRRNKIIILDEATANVDLQTDAMIQRTIREKFADCTVITVAHRLNTVIDSDRVLVMDAGCSVEFDAPFTLLENTDGVFHKMVKALGPQEHARLHLVALTKFENRLVRK